MSDWETTEGDHWAENADRYRRMLAGYADVVSAAAALQPGEAVLDVGCGCGDLSLAAADAVGRAGRVTGVDLSPSMLAVATRRAREAGHDHVGFARADATTHRPEPADFDVLVSRFGVMFFDDPTAAFTHLRSLMAPGGRVAFVCWQDLFSNDWMLVPAAAIAEVLPLPVPSDPRAPGPFAFADADRVRGILLDAGFVDPAAEEARASLWLGTDAADAAAFLRTTGMGRVLFAAADPPLVEEATALAAAALAPHETADGVALGGTAWVVTARVPGAQTGG